MGATVWTVGHSTRSLEELTALLREHGVRRVVDVRRFPGSRRYPHFGRAALAAGLARARIEYRHEPELGGRRTPRPESPNLGLRSAGFRGYADHMATSAFRDALDRVLDEAARVPTALLCAEAVPWRCHRWLIADALAARDAAVLHILGPGRAAPHTLTPGALLLPTGTLLYPAGAGLPRPPDAGPGPGVVPDAARG